MLITELASQLNTKRPISKSLSSLHSLIQTLKSEGELTSCIEVLLQVTILLQKSNNLPTAASLFSSILTNITHTLSSDVPLSYKKEITTNLLPLADLLYSHLDLMSSFHACISLSRLCVYSSLNADAGLWSFRAYESLPFGCASSRLFHLNSSIKNFLLAREFHLCIELIGKKISIQTTNKDLLLRFILSILIKDWKMVEAFHIDLPFHITLEKVFDSEFTLNCFTESQMSLILEICDECSLFDLVIHQFD
ncbi:hypothetical protein P9112_001017 [Eukaryota sp. TZLM1-RC]